jgi:3'-5' exoribonuclease
MYNKIVNFASSTILISDVACKIADIVAADPKFCLWPGSSDKHHSFDGGLTEHTYEVIYRSMDGINLVDRQSNKTMDGDVLFVSALLHDYGKIHVYTQVEPNVWVKTPDYTKSLHIQKSDEYFWNTFAHLFDSDTAKHISHCIRAHHGRIDYGSLEEPRTPEAWAVHLADMYSVFCVADRKP